MDEVTRHLENAGFMGFPTVASVRIWEDVRDNWGFSEGALVGPSSAPGPLSHLAFRESSRPRYPSVCFHRFRTPGRGGGGFVFPGSSPLLALLSSQPLRRSNAVGRRPVLYCSSPIHEHEGEGYRDITIAKMSIGRSASSVLLI